MTRTDERKTRIMAPFSRRPEWEQPADRHTPLKDPVLTVRQLSRLGFVSRRLTRIDHALVLSSPAGGYTTYLPPLRPTRRETLSRRYTAVYEVDMGLHPLDLELALPSVNDALQFEAVLELTWQVGDPAVFVASGIRHVPRLLSNELEQAARPVTRCFPVTDSAEAEAEVLYAVNNRGPLGTAAGLVVTWTLRLHRDRDNIDHQRRMQAIDHAASERIHSEQRGMAQDAEISHRVKRQDELEAERAFAYGERRHEVLLQQQQWQAELREVELGKIDFYQKQLEHGGVRAWALHLAEHPEDSRLVVQSLREDQLGMIRAKADMVAKLLDGNDAEGYELEEPKKLALRALHDILNQQLPGATTGKGARVPRLPASTARPAGGDLGTWPAPDGTEPGPEAREPLRWPEACSPTAGVSAAAPYASASHSPGFPTQSRVAAANSAGSQTHVPGVQDPAGMFPGWQPPLGHSDGRGAPSRPARSSQPSAESPGRQDGESVGPTAEMPDDSDPQ